MLSCHGACGVVVCRVGEITGGREQPKWNSPSCWALATPCPSPTRPTPARPAPPPTWVHKGRVCAQQAHEVVSLVLIGGPAVLVYEICQHGIHHRAIEPAADTAVQQSVPHRHGRCAARPARPPGR
jgi:hypothetical protein